MFYAPVTVAVNTSQVFFRETRNETILKKATDLVRSSFIKENKFVAKSAFISTWKDVVHADGKFPSKVSAVGFVREKLHK